MRVISGDLKGRPLKAVSDKTTRPTADKVKEAVFQVMGPYFRAGVCLDLFAGSGAMGIEALSRGMDKCVFIDQSASAIKAIRANLQTLDLMSRAEIHRTKAQKALLSMADRHLYFDLIVIDPPYKRVDYISIVDMIIKHNLLNQKGLIYCEHDPEEALPVSTDLLSVIKKAQYGKTTAITIYQFTGKGEGTHE